MSDLEFMQQILQLPLTVILSGVIVFLWRKLDSLQSKYETVLIEMGQLRGKLDAEIRIEQKLEQLYEMQKPKQ